MDYHDGGRDVQKRLSELRVSGAIYEVRNRTCKITGHVVIEWDLTDDLPDESKIKKTLSFSQKKTIITNEIVELGRSMEKENSEHFSEHNKRLWSIYHKV